MKVKLYDWVDARIGYGKDENGDVPFLVWVVDGVIYGMKLEGEICIMEAHSLFVKRAKEIMKKVEESYTYPPAAVAKIEERLIDPVCGVAVWILKQEREARHLAAGHYYLHYSVWVWKGSGEPIKVYENEGCTALCYPAPLYILRVERKGGGVRVEVKQKDEELVFWV